MAGLEGESHGAEQSVSPTPVTVVITRQARKDKIKEFEDFLQGIIRDAIRFEGHQGVSVFRPADRSDLTYKVVFRFDSRERLARWEDSEARKKWHEIAEQVSDSEPLIEKKDGMALWFQGLCSPKSGPPRWKMTMLTWLAIYPLITVILWLAGDILASFALPLRTLILTLILVPLMSYGAVPWLARIFRRWLTG